MMRTGDVARVLVVDREDKGWGWGMTDGPGSHSQDAVDRPWVLPVGTLGGTGWNTTGMDGSRMAKSAINTRLRRTIKDT